MLVNAAAGDVHIPDYHLLPGRSSYPIKMLLNRILRKAVADGKYP